ncbi:MAG: hypothetical protein KAI47_18935 [Deltaproteobacteria bacterium]|nr:hypothetical protein [Deltaproteobacteria bacterium]
MRTQLVFFSCALALSFSAACSDDVQPASPDGQVDTVTIDSVAPDAVKSDGVAPDTVKSDGVAPDGPAPDGPAVDGVKPDLGTFDTSSHDMGGAGPGKCTMATLVALTNGTVKITGTTTGLSDEFSGLKCQGLSSTTSSLDAAQAYYQIMGKKDQWYRIIFRPSYSSAYAYVFTSTACTEAAIETDCQSNGATGASTRISASSSYSRVMYFKSTAAAPFVVAADGTSGSGSFELEVTEIVTPTNGTCATATALTLFNGKALVTGDSHNVMTADEYSTLTCGSSTTMDGPNAYYSFSAKAGQSYKITVTNNAGYYLYYYVFGSSCTESDIATGCASNSTTGVFQSSFNSGLSRTNIFAPPAAGTYHIAIDGTDEYYFANFNLEIQEFTPPTNGICAKADPIALIAGKATVNGSTLGLVNEYGTSVDCTSSPDYDGPQAYYKLTAAAGKVYKLDISADFSGYWYIFRAANCGNATSINGDCGSKGVDGANPGYFSVSSSNSIGFRPTQPGDYIIAIDSSYPSDFGTFKLDVEELTAPTNDKACVATPVTLVSGKATVNGNTLGAYNEFGTTSSTGINCDVSTVFSGPQVYYEIDIDATKGYLFTFSPSFSSAYLYVFQKASCGSRAPLDADCGSGGTSGARLGSISSGKTESISFSPTVSGKYVIAVDSSVASGGGAFAFDIEEIVKPQNMTCATAAPLTLTAGEVTVKTTTSFTQDEYPGLKCKNGTSSSTSSTLDGSQLYWSLTMDATKTYAVSATTTFSSGYLYIFDGAKACSEANIAADCQSGGTSGVGRGTISNTTGTAYFKPPTTGIYKIAIDSTSYAGEVTLKVVEFSPPKNAACGNPKALTLIGGTVTESGFTVGAADELVGLIQCGGSDAFAGGQTYYTVNLQAGHDYYVNLATDFAAELYLFSGSSACTATAIEADCASKGVTGDVAAISSTSGGSAGIRFRPGVTGTFYIAIDAIDAAAMGGYTLKVTESIPPTGQRLVIQEINTGSNDYVVVRNAGTVDVSLNGVELLLTDGTIASPENAFTFSNQMLKAGASVYLVEDSSPAAGDIYIGKGIPYIYSDSFIVLLCQGPCISASGINVIDAAQFGTIARSLPGGISFTGGPLDGLNSSNQNASSFTRVTFTGRNPTFEQSDWAVAPATR